MQSTYLSRSLFGCTRISLITVALFVGTLVLAGNEAQQPPSSQRPRLLSLPPWPSTRGCPRLCVS